MTRKQFRVAAGLPGIGGSCANILEHRAALWRFVDDPRRKSTGGSRSERGDAFAANLKSVVHTCAK